MSKRRSRPAKLLAVLVGIAAAFALFYLGLWVAAHYVTVSVPPLRVETAQAGIAVRCPSHAPGAKAGLVIRCFGDSFTQGVGASGEDTNYPAQLEMLLCARHPKLNVMTVNQGRGGHNSSESLHQVRLAADNAAQAPTIGIVIVGQNNEWNLHQSTALLEGYAPLPRSMGWLDFLQHFPAGKLLAILGVRSKGLLAKWLSAQEDWWSMTIRGGYEPILSREDDEQQRFLETWLRTDLSRIAETARRAGWKIMLGTYHLCTYNSFIVRLAVEQGLPLCPPPRGAEEWNARGWLSKDEWHPNDLGYAAFAEHIAACLDRHGLIPTEGR